MLVNNQEKIIDLYEMMFKRKSIRKFDKNLSVSNQELEKLKNEINNLVPLVDNIKVAFVIVDRKETTAQRGEYCLLMYSEEKPFYLQNVGYMLEQVDLFLTALDIGVCWYGVAKPEAMTHDGLKYAVMLAFGKCQSKDFRVDLSEFKRKPVKNIWKGNAFQEIGNELRIAPSGCNLQPWRIISEEKTIRVFRQFNMRSFPAKKREFYSETDFSLIDMGICLCYLELSLGYHGYSYNRKLHPDDIPHEELTQIATYHIE